MIRTRVIPCLLLKGRGLVKTTKFKDSVYVGDPINAVKIFNDKEVDELIFMDIDASREGRGPQFDLIQEITSECFMPICYGGGVTSIGQIEKLFSMGVEKVSLNSVLMSQPHLLTDAAKIWGAQSLIATIDYRGGFFGSTKAMACGGLKDMKANVLDLARRYEDLGAGEIVLNSIDRDGTRQGYDLELLKKVADSVKVPVVVMGGAGDLQDFKKAADHGASAAAAGSLFVFHGKLRGVLISYPSQNQLEELLGQQ